MLIDVGSRFSTVKNVFNLGYSCSFHLQVRCQAQFSRVYRSRITIWCSQVRMLVLVSWCGSKRLECDVKPHPEMNAIESVLKEKLLHEAEWRKQELTYCSPLTTATTHFLSCSRELSELTSGILRYALFAVSVGFERTSLANVTSRLLQGNDYIDCLSAYS